MAELLLAAAIVAIGILVGWRTKAWSNPAVIFSIFWGGISVAAVLVLPGQGALLALSYIVAAVTAFAIPSFILLRPSSVASGTIPPRTGTSPVILIPAILLPVSASILFVLHLWAQGLSLAAFLNDPARFGWHFVNLRYQGKVANTAYLQLATILNFTGAMIIGKAVANEKRLVLPAAMIALGFVPSLLTMFLFGDKGTLFQCAAFFCGGLIVGWLASGSTRIASRRAIIFGLSGALAMMALVTLALMIKIDGRLALDAELLTLLKRYSLSYVLGSFFAFSDWLSFYFGYPSAVAYTASGPLLGIQTFWGFAKYIFTQHQMPDGYYAEYFILRDVLNTNIFTMFRGLIIDFGLIGSLAFLAAAGTLSALSYRKLLSSPTAPIAQTIVIVVVGFIYSSYLISLATWTTPFVAAALCLIVLAAESAAGSYSRSRAEALGERAR